MALGWSVKVRRGDSEDSEPLAVWRSAVRGVYWLDDLVDAHAATCVGDGYPYYYESTVGAVVDVLRMGDVDFATGEGTLTVEALSDLDRDVVLGFEVWDQS